MADGDGGVRRGAPAVINAATARQPAERAMRPERNRVASASSRRHLIWSCRDGLCVFVVLFHLCELLSSLCMGA